MGVEAAIIWDERKHDTSMHSSIECIHWHSYKINFIDYVDGKP